MIGFINVNKPSGITSSTVVSKIKKALKVKKVGHMGTLDPMACGVLPIAVGKATRMFDYFLDKKKTYSAIFEFGYETDTLDKEGKKLFEGGKIPLLKDIKETLPSFLGEIDQIPPQYSAKSVGGVRAYKLARQGKTAELTAKRITIYDMKVDKNDEKSYNFEIACSSGTYIRSICRDIAHKLGTFATMIYLQRTQSGRFDIQKAIKIEDINLESVDNILVSVEEVFNKIPEFQVDKEEFSKLSNGLKIDVKDDKSMKVFVKNKNKLLGIGQIGENKLKMVTNLADSSMQSTI